MEFEHSEKVRTLQARVAAFMAEEIYPNEEVLFAQVNEGDRWTNERQDTGPLAFRSDAASLGEDD